MTNVKKHVTNVSLTGLVQTCAFGTLVFSVITIFNGVHWYLELLAHFRLQYLISAVVCMALFIVLRKYRSAIGMLIIVVLNLIYVAPWYFYNQGPIAEVDGSKLTLMQSNVYTGNMDYNKLIAQVKKESPDILVAQEVNAKWMSELKVLEATYPFRHAIPREDNFGIAIFSKIPLDDVQEKYWGNGNVPSLQVEVTISGVQTTLIATHPLPPISLAYYSARNSQLDEISYIASKAKEPLIVIGDLNTTMWSSDYQAFHSKANLTNTRKGFGVLPTWPAAIPIIQIPIDHCLISSHFSVKNIKVGESIGSDHLPLIVDLQLLDLTVTVRD